MKRKIKIMNLLIKCRMTLDLTLLTRSFSAFICKILNINNYPSLRLKYFSEKMISKHIFDLENINDNIISQ